MWQISFENCTAYSDISSHDSILQFLDDWHDDKLGIAQDVLVKKLDTYRFQRLPDIQSEFCLHLWPRNSTQDWVTTPSSI
jgi:hypothetical protein